MEELLRRETSSDSYQTDNTKVHGDTMADAIIYEFLQLGFMSANPNALTVSGSELAGFDTQKFLNGQSIQSFPEEVRIYVEGTNTDIVNNALRIHIVSEQFANLLLTHVASQIELVPAPLFAKSGEKIAGYVVLNCLHVVDCIDWNASLYSKDEELDTLIVFDAAIDSDKVPSDISIFLVQQATASGIFLRMGLYERLKKPGGSDVVFVGARSSRNFELIDARYRRQQAAMHEEQECYQLIMRARELMKQNSKRAVREGIALARTAAEMTLAPLDMRAVAMGMVESGYRRFGEYLEALQVCESCLTDPNMVQAKGMFERSAARCEWRLGKTDQAIARLKNSLTNSLSEEEDERTKKLLQEIESSENAE